MPDPNEVVPVADAQPTEEAPKTEPEQEAALAQPEVEDEAAEAEKPAKELSEAERIRRSMQRRIDKKTATEAGLRRELELLQKQTQPAAGDDEKQPDIERIATERAREIVEGRALEAKAQDLLKAGRKIEGFQEAIAALRDEVPFTDSKGKVSPFLEALLESDAPAKLATYLGNNPDEAAEFADLSPAQIGRRLAKLEAKLDDKGKSKAPPPIEPIGGTRAQSTDLMNADMETYIKQRQKQGAQWSRR